MSLNPKSYAEALLKAQSRPPRPRQPLRQGGKGLVRSPLAASGVLSGQPGSGNSLRRSSQKAKTKKKRARMPSRKSLVTKLDRLTSLIVRLRDGGRCVLWGINATCTGIEKLQNGHIFGRRSHGARFDIEAGGNCAAQCSSCNIKHNHHQWIFYKWYIDRYGKEAFDAMYIRWSKGRKYSRLELIALCAEYQTKLAEMQSEARVAGVDYKYDEKET